MEFDFWHWWVLAAALLTLEVILPTFFFIWLGAAAFVTGIVLWLMPSLSWEAQLVIFSALSVASVIASRIYYDKKPIQTDEPLLNRRSERYVGRVITLKAPIVDGTGKIQVDDSTWKVVGEDCPAGTKVRVTSADNVLLYVDIV
jgi:membrane protein implicated in regulation of membrane protease activity